MKLPIASAVLTVVLVSAGGAGAATGKPAAEGSPPAILQYVEAVPTAGGSTPTEGKSQSSAPLSAKAARALHTTGGPDAKLLERVATDSGYGAPAPARSGKRATPKAGGGPSGSTQASAAPVVAVTDSSYSSRSWWVLTALAAIALAGVVATVVKTRRRPT